MKNNAQTPSDLAAIIRAGSPWKKRKHLLWAGAAVLLVGGCFWLMKPPSQGAKGQPYVTGNVHRGDLSLSITATGKLKPTDQITVGSEISGLVEEVYVDVNDHVTKGQPVAQIDTTKLKLVVQNSQASLASAKAQVALAEASVKQKEADLARAQELRRVSDGKFPSQADYDLAEANADTARATLLSAQAAETGAEASLRVSQNDLEKTTIRSPVDGLVLTRSVDPGQTVAASFNAPELFVIAEKLERMKLEITVAEADIGRVVPGLSATFTVDAWPERVYHATVKRVSYGSTVTNNVVTYETELEVSNDDLSLRAGMTATADIRVAESKGVLLVPTAALRYAPVTQTAAPDKTFLQRMIPGPPRLPGKTNAQVEKLPPGVKKLWTLREGVPVSLEVKTGLSDGRFTEISGDGVTENMPVILSARAIVK